MGVRQYIGARYVPKFFENPNNTSEWLPNVEYEPLTIVTFGLNTYTSKKLVPASVGDPSNNPEYWVATANFNAFVTELQDQIDEINENIQDIETSIDNIGNKKVLFIGDSIAVITNNSNHTFFDVAGIYRGLTENVSYFKNAVSGRGFTTTGLGYPNNFQEQIEQFVAQHSGLDFTSFTDVIICGGANDITSNIPAIESAMNTCFTYIKSVFTKATISVGVSAKNSTNVEGVQLYNTVYLPAYKNCVNYGAHYLSGLEYVLYNTKLTTDKLHPSAAGVNELGHYLAECMTKGSCKVYNRLAITNTDVTLANNVESITGIDVFSEAIFGDTIYNSPTVLSNPHVVLTTAVTRQDSYNIPLFTMKDFIAFGAFNFNDFGCNVIVYYTDENNVGHWAYDGQILKLGATWSLQLANGADSIKSFDIIAPKIVPIMSMFA